MLSFTWNDPSNSKGIYSTSMWLPNVDEGYDANKTVHKTLGGGVIVITQLNRTGAARTLPQYELTWEVADPEFLPYGLEAWDNNHIVLVTIPIRIAYDTEDRFTDKTVNVEVLEFKPKEEKGRLTSLRLLLQEVGV